MQLIDVLSLLWIAAAAATALVLVRVSAPYGRHARRGWGPSIPHRVGWVVMELVSPTALVISFVKAGGHFGSATTLLLAVWIAHYANRAVVYPLRAHWGSRRMPALVAAMAVVFNSVNGALNGWGLAHAAPSTTHLVVGLAIVAAGAAVNIHADETLLRLRRRGDGGYAIPRGGLYEWVSCPNYLGEIVEWIGFAIAAWTLPALSFAVWTVANLAPRALAHHRWYHETFGDYPARRRALVPGLI